MPILIPSLLLACSDYGLERALPEPAAGPAPLRVPLEGPPPEPLPRVSVLPSFHDFGVVDPWSPVSQSVSVTNEGNAPLTVQGITYDGGSGDMTLDLDEASNGPLPWELGPGETRTVDVTYTAVDAGTDQGRLVVASDDPRSPQVEATQVGESRFDGFATGWYIVDDDTPYDLTTDPAHRVDYDGDADAYWYEPSGRHGLTGSTDPDADFAAMRAYVHARAGGPTVVTGPLSFHADSDLPDMLEGSFTYLLCDFWMDVGEDPTRYAISMGPVDDGVRVIVNGEIVGQLSYNQSGTWPLTHARPGEVNSLLIVLVDNAMWEKYAYDIAFYKDGRMVGG